MGAKESLPDDGPAPEVHHYYSKFMRECPSGQLSLHEFKKLLDLQHLDPQGDIYIKRVFDVFDLNQVNFLFFISLTSCYCFLCELSPAGSSLCSAHKTVFGDRVAILVH